MDLTLRFTSSTCVNSTKLLWETFQHLFSDFIDLISSKKVSLVVWIANWFQLHCAFKDYVTNNELSARWNFWCVSFGSLNIKKVWDKKLSDLFKLRTFAVIWSLACLLGQTHRAMNQNRSNQNQIKMNKTKRSTITPFSFQ